MRRGVYRIIDLDLSRYDQLADRFHREQLEATSFLKSGIETRDASFNALIDRIEKVSLATTAPILLAGPTGAGKSQLARRIFELKKQRGQITGELVDVNCATIRGDQAMSALFGHTKGAFTGAGSRRDGLLKQADSGLLFLDEIGELGSDEQAMLLRAVEDKTFSPVGSDRPEHSNFQLIAGTNKDLRSEVASGSFREDLLARIDLWSFRLPGLAERRADIEPNLDYELARFSQAYGRNVTFNKEARDHFLQFALLPESAWRGNFRDLNAAITRMATLAPAARIDLPQVGEEIARLRASWDGVHAASKDADENLLATFFSTEAMGALDRFDRPQLAEVIRVCQESPSLASAGRLLFQASRRSRKSTNDSDRLRKYLAKFGLTWQQIQDRSKPE